VAETTQEKSSQLTLGDESHKITVSWNSKAPRRMLLVTSDPRFTDEKGEKPGLRTVFSANPKSADYDPAQFNRIARAMRSAVSTHRTRCRYAPARSRSAGRSSPAPAAAARAAARTRKQGSGQRAKKAASGTRPAKKTSAAKKTSRVRASARPLPSSHRSKQ
jgi:hypothetical protein